MIVGKEVAFNVTHTINGTPVGGALGTVSFGRGKAGAHWQEREFVTLFMAPAGPGQAPQDVASLIVASGWAKVRDGVGEGEEAVR